jgi:hypothetical protein
MRRDIIPAVSGFITGVLLGLCILYVLVLL